MSLRTRLLIGLVALAALALAAMGVVTYAEQRSFLYQRLDQQAVAAMGEVSHELDAQGVNVGSGGGSFVPAGPLGAPGGAPPGSDRGGRALAQLPPGTYGARRDATGHTVGAGVEVSVGGPRLDPPKLPPRIPVTLNPHDPRLISVGSIGKSGVRYRVLSFPTADQPGTTIVALPLHDVDQTLNRLLVVELLVAGGVLLALATLAWWIIRLGLRPLDRMGRTADAIAAGDLSRRVAPAGERTEVGRLGLALNAMLGQIERAFAEREGSENRLRRFVADASHELRTPLASIRGYAELFRIGAAQRPDDVAKAMRRIEEEAARMGVLVEDLLTLARLDEMPAAQLEPLDIARLATDAADDARATAPERTITLHTDGPAWVLGDADGLRQVMSNLMRNALVHTPAGSPIEIAAAECGDIVRLEVRDHGPGLPTEAHDAVFQRFWRAQPGRGRGPAGAGLGLAIVAAVVDAHGGSVAASNPPDGGASFVIRIPALAPQASEDEQAADAARSGTA